MPEPHKSPGRAFWRTGQGFYGKGWRQDGSARSILLWVYAYM